MIEPAIPSNEQQRLKELESFSILDTFEEEDFDNLTAIASQICETPISLVSLLDDKRQWFKSHHGLLASETPREYAFCGHAINTPDKVFVVNDSRKDERFYDNPLVSGDPNVVFYAGVPLVTNNGMALGTLCVIDHKPKTLTEDQLSSLKALSQQVVNLLYLRKREKELKKAVDDLQNKNDDLYKFAFVAAHDLSAPLKNISALTRLFKDSYQTVLDDNGIRYIQLIEQSSVKLRDLVNGLLEYSRNENYLKEQKVKIETDALREYINGLFSANTECSITWKTDVNEIQTNRSALEQILINLISNAVKHNTKDKVEIEVGLSESPTEYKWYIKDNGPGIPPRHHQKIFDLFTILPINKKVESSTGIGLATVKKLVESMGGMVTLDSEISKGTTFYFSIDK